MVIIFSDNFSGKNQLTDLAYGHQIPMPQWIDLPKLSNKYLKFALDNLDDTQKNQPILCWQEGRLQLIYQDDTGNLVKTGNNWHTMTQRIVRAGRKSELILQACKLTPNRQVIDGTAGFGHDGLILASTGAFVLMVEKNPALALMLLVEKQRMSQYAHWQKLLARLKIVYANFCQLAQKSDLVYLDPMFPVDSYRAKVGKNRQVLHDFILPPTFNDETIMLHHAKRLAPMVVVKRPKLAPNLAQQTPTQSVGNDVIRFDKYDKKP